MISVSASSAAIASFHTALLVALFLNVFQPSPFPQHTRFDEPSPLYPSLWKGLSLSETKKTLDGATIPGSTLPANSQAPLTPPNFLPLEWLLQPRKAAALGEPRVPLDDAEPFAIVDRILARLIQGEAHEPDVWLRDDYRQSFITVALAAKGSPIPFVEASYRCYGLHPDKVWPSILARRSALLGPSALRKPVRSETSCKEKRDATV